MDIKDFQQRKKQMENDILAATTDAIKKFQDDTGCSPHGFDFEFIEVTSISDDRERYQLFSVKSSVDV